MHRERERGEGEGERERKGGRGSMYLCKYLCILYMYMPHVTEAHQVHMDTYTYNARCIRLREPI
jgi:hypothetical protein